VVTFTEAAASELRGRVRRSLAEAGLLEALRRLPLARISTIHGFASFVLRTYSHITGVEPGFETVESHFTQAELAGRWDRWLASLPDGEVRRLEPLLERTDTSALLELARAVEGTWWLEGVDDSDACGAVVEYLRLAAPAALSLMRSGPSRLCTDPGDRLLPAVEALEKLLDALLRGDPPTPDEAGEALAAVSLRGGSQANWGGRERLAEVKAAVRAVRDALKGSGRDGTLLEALLRGAEAAKALDGLVRPFVGRLRREWAEDASRLSFGDLLVRCTDALRNSPGLRRLLSERFSHLLVDEFQDTSGLQVELFSSFLEEAGRAFGPGRITVVGDPKQSIYGWRSADVQTYRDTIRGLEEGGSLCRSIEVNFRSTAGIIGFVNDFGARLFAAQAEEERPYGCDYSPLSPSTDAAGPPVTAALVTPPEEGRLSAGLCAETIAGWVASRIREGVDGGARPGDYAVLMRRSTHADAFVDALEIRGLEASVAMRSDFAKRLELADLREMVRCLTSPGDTRAWVHTLRSSFFGLNDLEVTRAISVGCRGMDCHPAGVPSRVEEANRMLRRLRCAATELPLADFLYQLLLSTDMMAGIAASGYSVQRRLGSLATVLEMAMEGEAGSCGELVEMLGDRAPGGGRPDPAIPRPDMQAVTVTTVHRSKGLSYPHVFLCETSFGSGGHKDVLLCDSHRRQAAAYLGPELQTPSYPLLALRESARAAAETRRLFYVAATRPEVSLTVAMAAEGGSAEMEMLRAPVLEAVEAAPPGRCRLVELEPAPLQRRRAARPELDPASRPEPVPPKTEAVFETAAPEEEDTPAKRLGTAVHAILERIDHDDPEGWIAANRELLEAVCGDMFEQASRLALALFSMELPFELPECRVVGREYPLVIGGEGRPQERYIDLLLDDGESLIVVDYKTDRVPPPEEEGLKRLVEEYRGQQEGYLEAVRTAFGRPARAWLVFLSVGRAVEVVAG
jgi:ATP-dependent helicase/nuclease subunit A